jgi:parallel beta-helix repeat protein
MIPTRAVPRALAGAAAIALSFGGVGAAVLLTAGPASADAITVTNTADDGSATSLRGVLENVNDGDVVVLTAGATYQLTICDEPAPAEPHALEGTPGWGDIEIDGAVTIEGNGATIEQTCPDRVLYTQDEITLQDVTVTGGDVEGRGGGLFQDSENPVRLIGVTVTGNTARDGGGGVAASGDVGVSDSTFSDNHDTGSGDGGGLRVVSAVATVKISGSTFTGNTTTGWGGAFEQDTGEGGIGSAATGVFALEVDHSTITGNTADSDGAGGLDTEDSAQITIIQSTISDNHGGLGGGLLAIGEANSLLVDASTVSGNTADGNGGGVLVSGNTNPAESQSSALFLNSTVTRNTSGSFGAINVGGPVTLTHATVTDNTSEGHVDSEALATSGRGVSAQAVGDDAANLSADTLTSFGSVVALPHGAGNCSSGTIEEASAESVSIPSTDQGYNFSDDDTCGFTASTSNVRTPNDPVLGPLADNGGPTQTLLPLATSPLLDAIPPATCGAVVDQRGVTRPQGTGCDIGAVEVEVVAPAPAGAAVVTPKFTG